jgi:hypothetical protein
MIQSMKLRRLLWFSLLVAGCKTAGMPDKQQALLSERQKLEAVQPQSTETHQNIARAMFPDAPKKTQSADCFSTLTPEMSVQAVVQKCGRPDEEVGSGGVFIFVWHMPGGSSVSVSTPTLERIGEVKYTKEPDNRSSPLHGQ